MDPALGHQGHRELDHLWGLRDHDRLALEATTPGPLPTMMPLDVVGGRFALDQFLAWYDGRIGPPFVRAVHLHVPLRQTIHHLLQRLLVPSSTFPVQQLPGLTIQRFPDPEFLVLLLQVMPQLIQLEDDRFPCGFGLLIDLLYLST